MGTGGIFLRRARARISDEPTGFVWVVDRRVAGSGYPASKKQVGWIQGRGIGAVLSLTERPLPREWTEGFPLTVAHIPMIDHASPGLEDLERAVAFIEEQVQGGRPVLVHCLAGEGRTGCVLAAYLIRTRRIGALEAIGVLREKKPSFVERGQEQSVYGFARQEGASND